MTTSNTIQTVQTVSFSDAAPILEACGIEVLAGESKQVNLTLELSGVVSKGLDTEASATVKTLSLATLGCILRHCGITRESAIDAALLAVSDPSTVTLADKAWAEEFKTRVANTLPKLTVSGRRTGKLAVRPFYAASMPDLS